MTEILDSVAWICVVVFFILSIISMSGMIWGNVNFWWKLGLDSILLFAIFGAVGTRTDRALKYKIEHWGE